MVETPETDVQPNAANGNFLATNLGEAGKVKYQANHVRGRGTALTRWRGLPDGACRTAEPSWSVIG